MKNPGWAAVHSANKFRRRIRSRWLLISFGARVSCARVADADARRAPPCCGRSARPMGVLSVSFSAGSLIPPILNPVLEAALHERLARHRSKGGSFGELEPLAVRLGLIANSLKPRVRRPRLMIFASDHGLARGGD